MEANLFWVLASVSMGYIAMIARGLRWSNLLEPLGYFPKKWNNIHAVALSYFVSLGIPRSGEIVRCTAINQVENIPVDKLFGTVILERVIDSSILLLFIGFAVLFNYDIFVSFFDATAVNKDPQSSSSGIGLLGYLGITLVIGLLILIIFRKKILSSKLWRKAKEFIKGMKEGFLSISKMKKRTEFILYSITIWGMYYLSMIAMFKALQIDQLGWNEGLFLVVAGGLGVIIPTNGGVGAYHFLIQKGVLVLGLAYAFWPDKTNGEIEELGLQLAWLQWGSQTLMMITVGVIAMIAFASQRKKINASPIK